MLDNLYFNNQVFPVRNISIDGWGENLMIATEDLQDCLFDKKGSYIHSQANRIDEEIFYFVDKDEIVLSQNELSLIISANL